MYFKYIFLYLLYFNIKSLSYFHKYLGYTAYTAVQNFKNVIKINKNKKQSTVKDLTYCTVYPLISFYLL